MKENITIALCVIILWGAGLFSGWVIWGVERGHNIVIDESLEQIKRYDQTSDDVDHDNINYRNKVQELECLMKGGEEYLPEREEVIHENPYGIIRYFINRPYSSCEKKGKIYKLTEGEWIYASTTREVLQADKK